MTHGGKETTFRGVRLFGRSARLIERLFLNLAVGHVAHHRHHLGVMGAYCLGRLLQRTAAHFDPDKVGRMILPVLAARHVPPDAEFDVPLFTAPRRVGQRGEISGPIGDVNAIEQAVPQEPRHLYAQHRLCCRRNEFDGTVAAVA